MRDNLWLGIAIGAGAALFAPRLWGSGRPAMKLALRAALESYAALRVTAARMTEEFEDILAEVQYEMQETAVEKPGETSGSASGTGSEAHG